MSSSSYSAPVHEAPEYPVDFHPERTHLLSAAVMICILLLVVGVRPEETEWLGFNSKWLILLLLGPAVFIYWILRARTRITEEGITTRPAFSKGEHVPWDEVAGLNFRKSKAFLATTADKQVPLPAVHFNSIPKLSAASQGRFPDVINEGYAAATDKVVIIRKDGRQVIVSRDEYEARKREQGAQENTASTTVTKPSGSPRPPRPTINPPKRYPTDQQSPES